MKKYLPACFALFISSSLFAQETNFTDTTVLSTVQVSSVLATDKMPVTKTNLTKAQIQKNNVGQDLPFLLNQTPAVVINSDAGNGIGYTGIRIRGSDASRINVTLNGIPYNDAESQGSYFVDLPDIASSTAGIQIQRGVGTSTNGAGAFGGSIHVNTNELITKPGIQLNNAAGSYNSFKNTLVLNSGLVGKHFTFDARASRISSDGYVDRASTNLKSLYESVAFVDIKNTVRLNLIHGKEKTYQSWNGVTESQLINDRTYNSAGTDKPGEPYDNETDNYKQTHVQLFYTHNFSKELKADVAAYYTHGEGYYEQYKTDARLNSYGLPILVTGTDTTRQTDLVRRLWLNNDLVGTIFSLQYKKGKTDLVFGGGYNTYKGNHYGEIISASIQAGVPKNYRWYDHNARKNDLSVYGKWTERIAPKLYSFIDLQVRNVTYNIDGFRDNPDLKINNDYSFFNPKAGLTYASGNTQVYFSYGRANKEPNRDDFETGNAPKPEQLNDFELGLQQTKGKSNFGINAYLMDYHNQLVLTGEINDVGSYTRTNIKDSYRAGVEMQGSVIINKIFSLAANVALSKNKVKNFSEFIDDYDAGGQLKNSFTNTDIAFSPNIVAGATVSAKPIKNLEIDLPAKYVGRQYLDNTSNKLRSLSSYYTQDILTRYRIQLKKEREIVVFANVYNLFSRKYTPNGYTFSYIAGGNQVTENYYFPMAPVNFMGGVNIKL